MREKCSNPYCLYEYHDFAEKNFENFIGKRKKFSNDKEKNFFILLENLLIKIFKESKRLISGVIENLKNQKMLTFPSFLLLYSLINPMLFSHFVFIWNYISFIFAKALILFVLKNKIFSKENESLKTKKKNRQSIYLKKFFEMVIFFNGAIRSFNMLAV
uniref:Uncharacterized protein n=1 Tax=Hemiselmis andersenii TaxID=464988 RepID=A0A7S0TI29_HEMAN